MSIDKAARGVAQRMRKHRFCTNGCGFCSIFIVMLRHLVGAEDSEPNNVL